MGLLALAVLWLAGALTTLSPEHREIIRRRGLWSMAAVADYLCIDRTQVYNLVRRGDLHITKQGRRSYIAADELVDYLTRLQEQQRQVG
jgi:DNA-directed RNA polymerase specialized sigma24 family protein